jgi:hypothetical protein
MAARESVTSHLPTIKGQCGGDYTGNRHERSRTTD